MFIGDEHQIGAGPEDVLWVGVDVQQSLEEDLARCLKFVPPLSPSPIVVPPPAPLS
jgi:hypothetical protein